MMLLAVSHDAFVVSLAMNCAGWALCALFLYLWDRAETGRRNEHARRVRAVATCREAMHFLDRFGAQHGYITIDEEETG